MVILARRQKSSANQALAESSAAPSFPSKNRPPTAKLPSLPSFFAYFSYIATTSGGNLKEGGGRSASRTWMDGVALPRRASYALSLARGEKGGGFGTPLFRQVGFMDEARPVAHRRMARHSNAVSGYCKLIAAGLDTQSPCLAICGLSLLAPPPPAQPFGSAETFCRHGRERQRPGSMAGGTRYLPANDRPESPKSSGSPR
jgi:hypothetical protein